MMVKLMKRLKQFSKRDVEGSSILSVAWIRSLDSDNLNPLHSERFGTVSVPQITGLSTSLCLGSHACLLSWLWPVDLNPFCLCGSCSDMLLKLQGFSFVRVSQDESSRWNETCLNKIWLNTHKFAIKELQLNLYKCPLHVMKGTVVTHAKSTVKFFSSLHLINANGNGCRWG